MQGQNNRYKALLSRRSILKSSLLASPILIGGVVAIPKPAAAADSNSLNQIRFKPVSLPQQVPVTEGFVDVGGAKLWYWDTGGAGEAVVLLHAGTGSGAVWGYQQPVLAEAGFRVIGYSRRGYYKSEAGPEGDTGTGSADLLKLVDALQLSKFHLIGTAAGGLVATDFALSYPDRVSSMVLACSIGGVTDKDYVTLSESLRPEPFDKLPNDFRELGPAYRAADPAGATRWKELEHIAIPGKRVRQAYANEITWANLSAMRVPTLLMTGDADPWLPPPMLQLFADRIPQNEMVVIDGAGHSAYWERPTAFNRVVMDFIGKYKV